MADDEAQQGTRTCPVCDEAVSAQATVCHSCNTDLSLFAEEELDAPPQDAEALKNHLMANGNGHLTDLLKVADDETETPATEPAGQIEEAFECPECNGAVPSDANACPHCGVEFELEEVFECPMCSAMIDVTVDKCPSCGAEFENSGGPAVEEPADISSQIVEAAEPISAEASPEAITAPDLPEPDASVEPDKPAEPVSFADRLKQVKDTPSTDPAPKPAEPKKELSFAERMKAMKEGTLEEPEKTPEPAVEVKPTTPSPEPVIEK
ncbi:MAG: zinc ribbon domain-containing protein, partial [Thermoplasmata archaeon]|nr:zinc ribbon domain-containing protein [Thermoplasmata archaeon]